MNARKPIPKSLRFRVLERDRFTCRYCGAQPPAVVLHLDHALAHAKGGQDTYDNLVTACLPCNLGKGVMDVIVPGAPAIVAGKRRAPRLEFFWAIDYSDTSRPLVADARCLIRPSQREADAPWEWDEFNRYWHNKTPAGQRHFYSTHGASTAGFSPYEAAMYAAEIVHRPKWSGFGTYLSFVDDLLVAAEAGQLPDYVAPFVLRALHAESVTSRCGRLSSENEYIADRMAAQAIAIFANFLDREHAPWRSK